VTGAVRTLLDRLQAKLLTPGGAVVAAAVPAAATTLAVTFARAESASYGVLAVPSWGTTVSVGSKATTGFTFTFGTAAPGGGGTIDYLVFHADL
jgi:hypothetical protein